jgi:hypothetical protein
MGLLIILATVEKEELEPYDAGAESGNKGRDIQ